MKTRFNYLIYILSAFVYIFLVLSNKRDYQDSWILQDIYLPTIIFIFIFLMVVIFNNDNKSIALISSSFLIIMYSIPAMKYELFYGISDTTFHYRFVYQIMTSGHIPKDTVYSGTPGLQIFISLFSMMSGISSITGFKYAMPIAFGVYPLLIYFVSNKLIKNDTIQKYTIISSAFPFITVYQIVGTIFPLLFLILFGPLVIMGEIINKYNRVEYRIVLIIILSTILISHTMTPLLFIIFTTGCSIILLLLYNRNQQKDVVNLLIKKLHSALSLATILYTFWWVYNSEVLFSVFVTNISKILSHFFGKSSFGKQPVPQRFFEIPFISKIQILSINYLADFIIAILSIYGIYLIIRGKISKNKENTTFYSFSIAYLLAIIIVLGIEVLIQFGDLEIYRLIDYALIFNPYFVGISFYQFAMKINNKAIIMLIIFLIFSICLIQFYPYQTLIPKADIINKNTSGKEPIYDFHHVNTLYQKDMISFASDYSTNKTIIIADTVTRAQTKSFFNQTVEYIGAKNSSIQLYYNPLSSDNVTRWNLFLLHWNGKSGPFLERAEYRSDEFISKIRNANNRNLIYDNGESFIIQKNEKYE